MGEDLTPVSTAVSRSRFPAFVAAYKLGSFECVHLPRRSPNNSLGVDIQYFSVLIRCSGNRALSVYAGPGNFPCESRSAEKRREGRTSRPVEGQQA